MHGAISCDAAIHCAMHHAVPISLGVSPAQAGKGNPEMFIAFLRYLHAWRQYGVTVRELSGLSDHELADLGITRSDIPHVAWEQPRNTP
jgi:uncharacterized protein YjiS (DUF1127 family)